MGAVGASSSTPAPANGRWLRASRLPAALRGQAASWLPRQPQQGFSSGTKEEAWLGWRKRLPPSPGPASPPAPAPLASCLGRWHAPRLLEKAALDGQEPGPRGAAGALVLAWFKWKYLVLMPINHKQGGTAFRAPGSTAWHGGHGRPAPALTPEQPRWPCVAALQGLPRPLGFMAVRRHYFYTWQHIVARLCWEKLQRAQPRSCSWGVGASPCSVLRAEGW